MNVASLEVCKELYRVSGWKPTAVESEMNWRITVDETEQLWARLNPQDTDEVIAKYPAYDLGYLVRKMEYWFLKSSNNGYRATFVDINGDGLDAYGDTPENAMATLCTVMFKKGIFKKED